MTMDAPQTVDTKREHSLGADNINNLKKKKHIIVRTTKHSDDYLVYATLISAQNVKHIKCVN